MNEQSSIPVEAQAVPDLPVARVSSNAANCIEWLDARIAVGLPEGTELFTRPTPAAADLHQPLTLEQSLSGAQVCCGEYASCHRACTPRGRWQASQAIQEIEREFVALEDLPAFVRRLQDEVRASRAAAELVAASPAAAAPIQAHSKSQYKRLSALGANVVEPAAGVPTDLIDRIDAAIQRIVNGQACMRIPAESTDPDLVLAECKRILKASSPVAPVGAPTEAMHKALELGLHHARWSRDRSKDPWERALNEQDVAKIEGALLSRQGCELRAPTDSAPTSGVFPCERKEIPMRYECIESKRDGGWAVEAIDYEGEGEISRVLFTGANDEKLAREYASWKNASAQSLRESCSPSP